MSEELTQLKIADYVSPYSKKRKWLIYQDFYTQNSPKFWNVALKSENINIDLQDLEFISHDGAIWIAYISAIRRNNCKKTYITLPHDIDVVGSLKGIGFEKIADGEFIHFKNASLLSFYQEKYKYKKEVEKNLSRIIFIKGIHISPNLNQLIRYLNDYLIEEPFKKFRNSNISDLVSTTFPILVTELIKNIIDYGGEIFGSGNGFCSLVPPIRQYKTIRYCFSDLGKGFKYTLLHKDSETNRYLGKIDNDKNAILKGLFFRQYIPKENIIGLFPVLGIICSTKGKIGVRSGNSIVEIDFKNIDTNEFFKKHYFESISNDIDQFLEIFDNYIKHKKSFDIPGSHINIDLGMDEVDTRFLEEIYSTLE